MSNRAGQIIMPRSRLSAREIEVVAGVADGLNNREIAARLWVSVETVKSHLKHVTDKLQARNRSHIVALAFRKGLLS